jgi:predicted DNA binding CopG/RHH family protein
MRNIKLSRKEKEIERAVISGEYVTVSKDEYDKVADAINMRKKDSVLNIRINSQDLDMLKKKAIKHGVKYQSFISEFLHRLANN